MTEPGREPGQSPEDGYSPRLLPRFLLKAGSLSGSMGVYLPAMVFHKTLGLVRALLFAHFISLGENGLWGLGLTIFSVLAPLVCLGSNHGLARYVSFYEARGALRRFLARARWAVLACCLVLGLVALAAAGPISRLVIAPCKEAEGIDLGRQLALCQAAIANAFLLALYYNLLAFLGGMRLYRLISAIEILFSVLFVALGCSVLAAGGGAMALLLAHLAAVGLALATGTAMLHVAVRRTTVGQGAAPDPIISAPIHPQSAAILDVAADTEPALVAAPSALATAKRSEAGPALAGRGGPLQIVRFGLLSLLAGELWVVANRLSFFLTSRAYGVEQGGVFDLFCRLGEPVAFLSAAAWTVVYGHVARRWEDGKREEAVFNLETAYKAVAAGTMTLAVVVLAAAPLWLRVLDPRWRPGAAFLPGLLLFFQMVGNLGLLSMAAWLLERPAIALLPPAAGIAANWLLAACWMPLYGAEGAAWAAGAGMAVGGGLSAVLCLSLARMKLSAGTYLLLLSPVILGLAPLAWWAPPAAWAVVLIAALATGWVFDRNQKALLWATARRILSALHRRPS